MYPTKSRMLDYMSEMTRQSGGESDTFQSPLARTSLFSQSTMAHSSSSTETSPDSFPDLTPQQFQPEFRPEEARRRLYQRHPQWKHEHDEYDNQYRHDHCNTFRAESFKANKEHFEGNTKPFESHVHSEFPHRSQHPDMSDFVLAEHIYETPPIMRRQRPIIGRKIMTTADTPLKTIEEFPIWQPDMPHTPPKSLERKCTSIYELFASENRGFEFPSPNKTPHASPQFRTSPRISLSPKTSRSVTPPPQSPFSPRMPTPFKEPLIGPSVSFTSYGSSKMCTFCRKNGETPVVYMTHTVKEKVGNRNVVTCPILRSHVCSTCGASGDDAHTITYCPVLRSGNNGQPLQSTTITLKNTRVKSNGRRRY